MTPRIPITGDADTDLLLEENPLALLIGMLLDQQVPMEWAFRGPASLDERLGGLDAAHIAAMAPEDLEAVFKVKPALHRYPGSMAKRTHALCQVVVDDYDGRAEAIWEDVSSGAKLLARLHALPGYGEEKSKIFIAILAKRLDVKPRGWKSAAAPFSDKKPRSVADVSSPETLLDVREWKKAKKAAGKNKQQ
jgi:uncharacterized HhH-GPD family protein